MGLVERRKIKELQETTFPDRVKEIEEICGKGIPYEVDRESLTDPASRASFSARSQQQRALTHVISIDTK
jgi:hypothetical protein